MSDLLEARLQVDYQQTWVVPVRAFVESFPAEWEDAQKRGLDEREFALESIKIMGENIRELAMSEDDDWDVVTL